MSFLDALGPPVEERGGADQVRAGWECDTVFNLGVFERIHTGEMALGQRSVGQRPQLLAEPVAGA